MYRTMYAETRKCFHKRTIQPEAPCAMQVYLMALRFMPLGANEKIVKCILQSWTTQCKHKLYNFFLVIRSVKAQEP